MSLNTNSTASDRPRAGGEPTGSLIGPIAGTAFFMAVALAGGYLRDALVASQLGARSSADGYFFGIQFSLAFQALFLLGALAPALVPALRAVAGDRNEFAELAKALFAWVVCATVAVSAVLVLIAGPVVGLLGAGLDHAGRASAVAVIQTSVPMLPFVAAGVTASAILNVRGRFALPAAAWAISNLATAVLVLPLIRVAGSGGIGLAWTIGNVLYVGLQIGPLQRAWEGGHWSLSMPAPVRRVFTSLWSISGFFAMAQVGAIAERVIAANLGSGSISQISYAEKLALIPTGVLAGAVSTVVFPRLSGLAADREASNRLLGSSLRVTVLVVTPSCIWLMAFAPLAAAAAFQRGALSSADASGIAGLLPIYALGTVVLAIATILVRGLFATGRQRFALGIGVLNTVFYVAIAVLLSTQGIGGLAWAWTVAQVTTALLAAVSLRWQPDARSVARFFGLLGWLSLATAAGLLADRVVLAFLPIPTGIGRLPATGALALLAVGISMTALLMAPIAESRQLRRRFQLVRT